MSPSKNLEFRGGKVTLTGDKIQCTKSQEGGTHGPCRGGVDLTFFLRNDAGLYLE